MTRIDNKNKQAKMLFGLVGFPLHHSFSKKFFTEKFKMEEIDAEYLNFETENLNELESIILNNPNLQGFNVTIPYKEKIIPLLSQISPEASKIGAVNVVKVVHDSNDILYKLIGYNTDYIGFKESIEPLLNRETETKALILGTGGASKSVAQVFSDIGISWKKVSRNPDDTQLSYGDLTKEIIYTHKIIVNATPVGTFPNNKQSPCIPYEHLTSAHLLYDLVYNPEETIFLKSGKKYGASTKNGMEMLERQALAAWKIWD